MQRTALRPRLTPARARVVMTLAMAAWIAGAHDARAENGIVIVSGTASPHAQAAASSVVEGAARDAGWSLPAQALAKKEREAVIRCSAAKAPWECLPASLAAADIRHVLLVTVDAKPAEDSALVLIGKLIVAQPRAFVVAQRFCDACDDARLGEESGTLAKEVLRELAVRSGRTVVEVRSTPPGAQILLDGARVGVTDTTLKTFPGAHVLVIEKPGFESVTREITVDDGSSAQVEVALTPRGDGLPPSEPTTPRSRLVPAILVGAGLAAIAGGIALQVVADPPAIGEDQPARLYSAPGIGLCVGGAIAIGIGAYLWTRSPATTRVSGPVVVPVAGDGAALGWIGSF